MEYYTNWSEYEIAYLNQKLREPLTKGEVAIMVSEKFGRSVSAVSAKIASVCRKERRAAQIEREIKMEKSRKRSRQLYGGYSPRTIKRLTTKTPQQTFDYMLFISKAISEQIPAKV
jgi:hypothetical protein